MSSTISRFLFHGSYHNHVSLFFRLTYSMMPWLQLINNCTALKHRLNFLVSIFFLAQIQQTLKKAKNQPYSEFEPIFCHQKLVPFGECIGGLFCCCFFCCLFVLFFLVCLWRCLFDFSPVYLEIIESIIKSFITFSLFALIFFTYQSTLKQDYWEVSASSLHFSKQSHEIKVGGWKHNIFTLLKSKVVLFTTC